MKSEKFITALVAVALSLILAEFLCLYILAHELREAKARLEDAGMQIAESSSKISAARRTVEALEDTVFHLRQENEAQAEELSLRKKLNTLPKMENCMVSHYCCELYEHICGTGNGITASGTQVTAGVSVAVDPEIIPLGSVVYVDYGDGEIHNYVAEDVGGAVKGAHIDVAVEMHDVAMQLGLRRATVWWEEK